MLFASTLGVVSSDSGRRWEPIVWLAFGVVLASLIGFRYQVGGDWGFEHNLIWRVQGLSIGDALQQADPGFAFIAWLVADSGFNVWTLNLTCGAIFTIGLLSFCRTLPDPWLAVTVAVPYLVIVVAMGYGRQSVAIGFFLLALVQIQSGYLIRFLVLMAFAASMHITATLLVPICILASRRRKLKTLVMRVGQRTHDRQLARLRSALGYLEIGALVRESLGSGRLVMGPDRFSVFAAAIPKISGHAPLYLEFGVFEGETMRWWSQHLDTPGARFVGFDSFEGLPEAWRPGFAAGQF